MSADSWQIRFTPNGAKTFKKLDRSVQKRLQKVLNELATTTDPRSHGKPLKGNLGGLWRWRVGDYRIIGTIEDNQLTIYIVHTGHRKDIYTTI